jgi:dipeptidyl aminopeptidase/acylaminoacyl peptidase
VRPEDIFEIAVWGQLVFDPARPRLYGTESRADKRTNTMHRRIVLFETGPGLQDQAPVPLTTGTSDAHPLPSPDGRWLAFVSRRSGSAQLWRLPLAGGEAIQTTFLQGGISDYAWSPDGQGVVVVAHIEDGCLAREAAAVQPGEQASDAELLAFYNREVRQIDHQYYKLDGEGFFDRGRDQLVWVPLLGAPVLLTNGRDHYCEPIFAAGGECLYCLRHAYDPESGHPQVRRVRRLDWTTRAWTELALPEWSITGLALSGDGSHLAFCATKPEELGYGLTTLYRYDLRTCSLTDLSSQLDRSVGDDSSTDVPVTADARPVWHGDAVLMLVSDAGRVGLANFAGGNVEYLWEERRVVYDFACRDDDVALAISDPVHPSGLCLARLGMEAGATQFAPTPWDGSSADGTDMRGPVQPTELWATAPDGTRVHTWFLCPPGPGPHPVILEIHGGPMVMYGYRYFHEFQCLVQAGYAVVYTNPRGSQGYGHRFCDAIVGQWGDKDYGDILAGLDAALAAGTNLDARRVGVAGGSYGGFMVNWMISHTRRFQAAVTMRSVVNRFSAMGSSDMGWLRVPQYGQGPWWEEPEPYWQQSPLRYVSAIDTPLLIEHQEQDLRLPIEQGEQLYSALKYLGKTVELLLYPGESHGMSRTGKPWHRVHRLHAIVNWFDRHLAHASARE